MDNYIDFDVFATDIDSDCVDKDFDDYDLYGQKLEESDNTYKDLGDSIDFDDDNNLN